MKIRIETLGCRLNLGEMDSLARSLARKGHRIAVAGEDADLCILNTCTVTGTASKKSRQAIRRLRRSHPAAALVVTGCYAELSGPICSDLGADLVVPNSRKDELADILEDEGILGRTETMIHSDPFPVGECSAHTRAFLKVQDGCDNHCTYCVVTLARGGGRSRKIREVLSEVQELESLGFREIVLTGVHLGSWGHDFGPGRQLKELVRAILEGTSIERIRLSSLEPWDLEPAFFDLFDDPRLMPHLHLPLQSGSDAILKRMARRTSVKSFSELVEAAHVRIPDLALTTDLIAGFPGETEEDFNASMEILRKLDFAGVHVFPFSPRPGTAAAQFPGVVPRPLISKRVGKLQAEAHTLKEKFNRRFLGRVMPVLWESFEEVENGRIWSGLTPNYIRVLSRTPPGSDLLNTIAQARLLVARPGALEAELS